MYVSKVLLSLRLSCVVCGFIGVYGWIQNAFVVIVDNLFSVIHAAVADLDDIAIKDFS